MKLSRVAAAVRMLGSSFFQEYAFGKKDKTLKTYDHTAFVAEEHDDQHDDWSRYEDEWYEDEIDPNLHDDEDSALIVQFENAVVDSVQEDHELAAFFSSYQEARKRLVEKTRSRGFWSNSKGKGSFGKKGFGKQKGKGFRSKSLAQRIAESSCRRCGAKGHWKAECPLNQTSSSDGKNVVPTSIVIDHEAAAATVVEPNVDADTFSLLNDMEPWHDPTESRNLLEWCFGVIMGRSKGYSFQNALKKRLGDMFSYVPRKGTPTTKPCEIRPNLVKPSCPTDASAECHSLFCSAGTTGVVDLGASQSVIGSDQLKELLEQLQPGIRSQLKRQEVDLIFRFGNHQTLQSKVAIHFPLHGQWFRVAVVHGKTPFLLSSKFLQTIQAVIDANECTLWSKLLNRYIPVYHNEKNLMMMNINDLWGKAHENTVCQVQEQTPPASRPTSQGDDFSMKVSNRMYAIGKKVSESSLTFADVMQPCPSFAVEVPGHEVVNHSVNSSQWSNRDVAGKDHDRLKNATAICPSSKVSPCATSCKTEAMSLHKQFQAYMGKNKDEEIDKIPLAILAETKIDLGKAKMNQTFAQAFQDKEWTNYMLTRFEDSQKPTHQKYFQYVKLMIQEDSQPSTSTVKTKVRTKKKEEMKTTRLGMVKPVDEEEEEDSDWERMTGVPTQQMTEIQINQNEMESRMGRMEEALAQVISHLQQLSTQGLLIQPKAEM